MKRKPPRILMVLFNKNNCPRLAKIVDFGLKTIKLFKTSKNKVKKRMVLCRMSTQYTYKVSNRWLIIERS